LRNANGDSSYATQAALNYAIPYPFAIGENSVWQPRIAPYVNKNNQLEKHQDNHGLNGALVGAIGDLTEQEFGGLAQVGITVKKDRVANNDAATLTVDYTLLSTRHHLGGTGQPAGTGYMFVPTAGIYSDDIRRSKDGAGLGRLSGVRLELDAKWYPWRTPTGASSASAVSFDLTAQVQRDLASTDQRVKETRRYFSLGISYLFFEPTSKKGWQPSIGLDHVTGADLLQGLAKQNYTQVSFKLKY